MKLRFLVVDDHEVVRMGVRKLIETHPDWQVCDEARSGEEAIEKVRELAPDVVILDILMSGINGFEAASEIRRIAPGSKIVLLSIHDVPVAARQVGADAFVSKGAVAQELVEAIERVTQSEARHAVSGRPPGKG